MLKQNIIRVPEGCPTMNEALELAVVLFSERNECTRENPVKIEVGEGKHEMVGVAAAPGNHCGHLTHVSCNNIIIVGKGKDKTTILGAFCVDGKKNVKIEQLTVANGCYGFFCTGSGSNVDVTECCAKNCIFAGMCVVGGATATATRCDFMENGGTGVTCHCYSNVTLNGSTMHRNGGHGLSADDHAVVDLCGTETDIHSNQNNGICARKNAKVNIHLASQHNITHDNVEDNRYQDTGGSIANINANGTFTHVEELYIDSDHDTDTDSDDDEDDGDDHDDHDDVTYNITDIMNQLASGNITQEQFDELNASLTH